MDERKRTLAAVTVIIGFLVLVIVVIGIIVSGKKILSPVPEDNAIKIIFVTPPVPTEMTEKPTPTEAITVIPTKKLTPKPTATPTNPPAGGASPSATPTP